MTETRFFALQGGLDLVTPAIQIPPGRAIAGSNYEPHPRGYQRVDGFERFDGRPKPSEASYWVLRFTDGDTAVPAGTLVTGAVSGATGTALIEGVIETGSYEEMDAAGYLVLTAVSGPFEVGEALLVSGTPVAQAATEGQDRGALTDENDTAWHIAAIEHARAAIGPVPGSGPVRGVWVYKGDIYAFRDSEDGTAGVMHKATPSGWQALSFGRRIRFGVGATEFQEGETVTGTTSGATATIRRVCLRSGAWDGTANGQLILDNVVGSFQNAEELTSASGKANSRSVDLPITLAPGGRYSFANYNFFGSADMQRMYGANGEGMGFEWDGEILVPIETGMEDDRPIRVAAHSNHLFFAFRGGSLQHSSPGDPYQWNVVTGAGEIGIGEEITDLLASVSGTLVVFGRNKVAVLFGNDAENWVLRTLSDNSGAVPWTAQAIGNPIYLDNSGLRSLETTEAFGDFLIGTMTQMVEPIFRTKRRAGVVPVGSLRVRAKDQYRLFFSDGTGLTAYFGRQPTEFLPFDLGFTITCTCSGKDEEGEEVLFAGSEDGWVYELDAGTSFDGDEIPAFLRLPFNHVGSPAQKKRWQRAILEVDAAPSTRLGMTAEFAYADPDQPPAQEQMFDVRGSGGFWSEMLWDNFYWSSPVEGQAAAYLDGIGRNMSITVVSNAAYEDVHVLHGFILYFTYRGLVRS